MAPFARLGDDLLVAQQHPARRSAETLVERHVDRVEERRDLRQGPIVEGPALPQSRAIEVSCDTMRTRPLDLGDEVLPGREPATDLALRQLEQERRDRLLDRLQVRERDQLA